MRNILLVLLLVYTQAAHALLPMVKEEGRTKGRASYKVDNKRLSGRQKKRLIGTWILVPEDGGNPIGVKITNTTGKRVGLFRYDIIDASGRVSDSNLIGHYKGGDLYFTVSYINGYSMINMLINKSGTKAFYSDNYVLTNRCGAVNAVLDGLQVYECVFPTAITNSTIFGDGEQ